MLPNSFKDTVADHYLPLGALILERADSHNGTFYLGVNGCQGSGKSTLSDFLAWYFEESNVKVAVLSLDDFYHDRATRKSLAEEISPLLATRGVPGTHNTPLMSETLHALSDTGSVIIPRFDKSQDNPFPKANWTETSAPLKIVIMEGWCWGVQPQTPLQLRYPVNALEAEQDPNITWRNWVNNQIAEHYVPLYEMMDFWVMLQAPGFESVFNWRLEQEKKLADKIEKTKNKEDSDKKQDPKNKIMSDSEVHAFIQFYQRLTEECLSTLPDNCDVVFKLDDNRKIVARKGL